MKDDRQGLKKWIRSSKECPSPEELAQIYLEQLAPSESIAIHVKQCPHCSAEIALMRSYEQAGVEATPQETEDAQWILDRVHQQNPRFFGAGTEKSKSKTKSRPGVSWSVPSLVFPVAASILVVLMAVAVLWRQNTPDLAPPDAGEMVTRSSSLHLTYPVGELDHPPQNFSWERLEAARGYRLTVSDLDGQILWEVTSEKNFLTVPSKVAFELLPGKPFLWKVQALGEEGQVLSQSEPVEFKWSE